MGLWLKVTLGRGRQFRNCYYIYEGKHSSRPPSLNLILTNSSANFAKIQLESKVKSAMCNTHLINCDFKVELSYKLRNSLTYNFKFWYFMVKMQLFPFTKFITFIYCEIRGFWFSVCLHWKTSDAKVQDLIISSICKFSKNAKFRRGDLSIAIWKLQDR